MEWMISCLIVYVLFYWLNKREKVQRRKLVLLCVFIVGLNVALSIWHPFEYLFPCISLGAFLFLFVSKGILVLLNVKRRHWFLHLIPLGLLTLVFLDQFFFSWDALDRSQINRILVVAVSVLSFVYGCFGYWYLINNYLHKILKQYVAFYIVILFCISVSFLLVFFYDLLLFVYIDPLFYVLSFCLLFGALVLEVRWFVYLKYRAVFKIPIQQEWTAQTNRLFGEVLLDVSLPKSERISTWGIPLNQQVKLAPIEKERVDAIPEVNCRTQEIRQMITEKLIEPRLFLNPTLNLEQLSSILNYPKVELVDFFKESPATSFRHYLNRLRVEYAILLIRENEENYTVEELSLLCGFNTRLSFYRAFVEVFGFAPSEILS